MFSASCFDLHGCGIEDDCTGDSDCDTGFVCDDEATFSLRRTCVAATECASNADCPAGNACIQRASSIANNPFEEDTPGKKVCVCNQFAGANGVCDDVTSSSSSNSSSNGSSSSGGFGGQGAGGQGGAGTGGATVSDGGVEGGEGGGT
ncbi:Hypothetical protein A7982_11453 [Minicystis rosea]|nr:Hypothetical protein A7982_11453 [Minicystis rosea]